MLKVISTLLLINLASSNSASFDIDINFDVGPSSGTPGISLNEKSNESPVLQEKSTGNKLLSFKALKEPEGSSQPPQCVAQDGICGQDSDCCEPEEMYCEHYYPTYLFSRCLPRKGCKVKYEDCQKDSDCCNHREMHCKESSVDMDPAPKYCESKKTP